MKKHLKLIITFSLVLFAFSSCKAKTIDTTGKIQIVSSIFPEYDWVQNITGLNNDKIIHKLLVKNGVDIHSFQPSANDIVNIANADILIYVGGESDKWISDALKNAQNKNMIVIKLMDLLKNNLKEEEIIEGMESEESETDEEDDEIEYDEHIWFSIDNVRIAVKEIANALCTLDPENQATYKAKLQTYLAQLNLLESKYKNVISSASKNTIIVCDRYPFRYLSDYFGLNYYAAFAGCSAETEASFETVTFLANKIDEINTNKVLILENSNDKLAKTIVRASKNHKLADILVLDSMQSTTLVNIMNGKSYISTMESNLEILKQVLN